MAARRGLFTTTEVLESFFTQGSEDEDDGESCNNEREEESDEDDTDLFEDVPFRLGENLDVGREAAQSESSFNSNPVRPSPDVDENVNLDLSVRSESESEDENMAVYDADTEVDDGSDVELNQDQQNYNSGEWQKNTNGFKKLPRFSAQPGIKVALSDDLSPLEVYKLFITDELINSWKPYVSTKAWTRNQCSTTTGHAIQFSTRFLSILAFLHINDNDSFVPHGQPDYDPIQKIRPFVDYLNAKFKEVYQPQREVCIDEAMIPFKGRSWFKVYMKDKPTKWGFKLYELCESSPGYVWSVEMYCAYKRISNKPVDVTMRLLQPLLDQGYRLYVENHYCCPDLWNQMQGRNTMLVGTCRKNRVGMPAESDLFQNRQRPGDFDFRRKGQLVATRWFDKRKVVTLSTIHQPQLTETIGRYEHRRRRTNLASVLKEVSVALVDKDVIYVPQADNVPLRMDRLKGRHFLSVCPNTEASDSRGKKAQRRCKVCADRAKDSKADPSREEKQKKADNNMVSRMQSWSTPGLF
ncbi:PiggyBac transposable element-derived protein 4-like [Plakobranchus ocellatus]|uniref:PiggyBac transposable element-derived protein 4-like n=1 Tax=Plakobranchus ocellatus TaxID=259542 RepID=A0AAV4AQC8_9GAST|nr:PiggyBac transposable element-derived protein 4-like [Plakobranchus ocellatus]